MRRRCYRSIAVVALLGMVMLRGGIERAFGEVPQQLDDRTFWKLVSDMSESGGIFPSENVVSNEANFQLVLNKLKERVRPGGVYLGVGPEQNFTYVAALQPAIAFIIDIRRQNFVQHLMYKAMFELAADRGAFMSILFSRNRPDGLNEKSTLEEILKAYRDVPADPALAFSNRQRIKDVLVNRHGFSLTADDLSTLDHVHRLFELYGPETGYGSTLETVDATKGPANGNFARILTTGDDLGVNQTFLAREERFRFVKDIERRNLVLPIVGDFGGEKALKNIAQYLKEQKATVHVFYLSNVEQYLFRSAPGARNGGAQMFYENVATLPLDASSTFIRVSNNDAIKQIYPGFTTHLGSVEETLQAFRDKRLNTLRDVFALSR